MTMSAPPSLRKPRCSIFARAHTKPLRPSENGTEERWKSRPRNRMAQIFGSPCLLGGRDFSHYEELATLGVLTPEASAAEAGSDAGRNGRAKARPSLRQGLSLRTRPTPATVPLDVLRYACM